MQYVRTPSIQPAAASRLAAMLGVPLVAAALQFYLWFAIGMMYGLIGRPRLGVVQC